MSFESVNFLIPNRFLSLLVLNQDKILNPGRTWSNLIDENARQAIEAQLLIGLKTTYNIGSEQAFYDVHDKKKESPIFIDDMVRMIIESSPPITEHVDHEIQWRYEVSSTKPNNNVSKTPFTILSYYAENKQTKKSKKNRKGSKNEIEINPPRFVHNYVFGPNGKLMASVDFSWDGEMARPGHWTPHAEGDLSHGADHFPWNTCPVPWLLIKKNETMEDGVVVGQTADYVGVENLGAYDDVALSIDNEYAPNKYVLSDASVVANIDNYRISDEMTPSSVKRRLVRPTQNNSMSDSLNIMLAYSFLIMFIVFYLARDSQRSVTKRFSWGRSENRNRIFTLSSDSEEEESLDTDDGLDNSLDDSDKKLN